MEGLIFGILRYLHRKSLFEMLIGRDDISNDVIALGTCFSMFIYILAHCFLLFADSWKSDSSVDREPQGNWRSVEFKFQTRSASSPSFSSPTARVPGQLALRLLYYCLVSDTHHRCCG